MWFNLCPSVLAFAGHGPCSLSPAQAPVSPHPTTLNSPRCGAAAAALGLEHNQRKLQSDILPPFVRPQESGSTSGQVISQPNSRHCCDACCCPFSLGSANGSWHSDILSLPPFVCPQGASPTSSAPTSQGASDLALFFLVRSQVVFLVAVSSLEALLHVSLGPCEQKV